MKVVATSDLHGFLPQIPPCDLLLIAGDVCPVWNHRLPFQRKWLRETFTPWLESLPARKIVGVWGNHDSIAESNPDKVPPLLGLSTLMLPSWRPSTKPFLTVM